MKIAKEILAAIAGMRIPIPPDGVSDVMLGDCCETRTGYYYDCEQVHEVSVFKLGGVIVTGPNNTVHLVWDENGHSEVGMSYLYWDREEAEKSFARAQALLSWKRSFERLRHLCDDIDALEEMAKAALTHYEEHRPSQDGDRR